MRGRHVVIPLSAVDPVTPWVFLRTHAGRTGRSLNFGDLRAGRTAQSPNFGGLRYPAPPDWVPPFPNERQQVHIPGARVVVPA
jgi:hypothetical protein